MNESLAANQIMSIVALTIIGVSILALPGAVAIEAGPDGWLSFALMWGVTSLAVLLIVKLSLRFPGQTVVEYSKAIVGKPLGTAASAVFGLMECVSGALVVRLFAEAVGSAVLLDAPLEAISGVMLLLVIYLAFQRVRVFGRVNALFFPVVIGAFLVFTVGVFQNAEMAGLTPVLARGISPVLRGALVAAIGFQGFEVLMYYAAFAEDRTEVLRAAQAGLGLVGLAYVLTSVGVTAMFGFRHLTTLQWPVLEAIKALGGVPGEGIERFESLFITIWMLAAFTTAGSLVHAGIRVISDSAGLKDYNRCVVVAAPVLYVIALAPDNLFSAFSITSLWGQLSMAWAVLLSAVLYVVAIVRGKRGDAGAGPSR